MSAQPLEPDSNEPSLEEEIEALSAALLAKENEVAEVVVPDEHKDPDYLEAEAKAAAAYEEYMAFHNQKKSIAMALAASKAEATQKKKDLEAEQRRIAYDLQQKRALAQRKQVADDLQAEFLTLEKRWDAMTMGAPWREWAKDHQIVGAKKIVANRNIIVADGMGLGKTLQSLIAMDMVEAATRDASPENPFLGDLVEKYDYESKGNITVIENSVERPCGRKILYLCPSPLVRNVEREVKHWTPHRNPVILGGMSRKEREFVLEIVKTQPEYMVICNYEAWRKDKNLLTELGQLGFDTVILDEAHNLKDTKTSAYRGVKKILGDSRADYVIPMTGTPILNKAVDFYALLSMIKPDEYYHLNRFLNEFCRQNEKSKWVFRTGGMEALAKRISGNYLRRTKDDAGVQLPPRTIEDHYLDVDPIAFPNQAKARTQMATWGSVTLGEDNPANLDENGMPKAISAAAIIAVFTRLRQIETWPAGIEIRNPISKEIMLSLDIEESQKLDYVIHFDKTDDNPQFHEWGGLLMDVCPDERTVVFSQFKAPLEELDRRAKAAGLRSVILNGDTPDDVREEIRVDFDGKYTKKADAKWDVVFANYRVGGTGLNMSGATQMVILDEEWNPGKRDQAYDRIHRLDSTLPVTIHVIRNRPTIDDWLAGLIEEKQDMLDGFNDANAKSMTDLWDEFKNSGLA